MHAIEAPRHLAIIALPEAQPFTPEIRKSFSQQYHADALFYFVRAMPDGSDDHSDLSDILEAVSNTTRKKSSKPPITDASAPLGHAFRNQSFGGFQDSTSGKSVVTRQATAQEIFPGQNLLHAQKLIHVNRVNQLRFFRNMIKRRTQERILLLCAESGMGKSSLLRKFRTLCNGVPEVSTQVGLMPPYGPPDVIDIFFSQLHHYPRDSTMQVRNDYTNWCMRRRRHPGLHTEWFHRFTEALISDLSDDRTSSRVFVLIIDDYHKAKQELRDWLCSSLLKAARANDWLITIIAGQVVPSLNIEFDGYYKVDFLSPLRMNDISRYLDKLKLTISADEIRVILEATQGRPLEIALEVSKRLHKACKRVLDR